MMHTPEFYTKAFELNELLEKALLEPDSAGKRKTLRAAYRLFAGHSEKIEAYLKTPEPEEPGQESDDDGFRGARCSWLYRGRY